MKGHTGVGKGRPQCSNYDRRTGVRKLMEAQSNRHQRQQSAPDVSVKPPIPGSDMIGHGSLYDRVGQGRRTNSLRALSQALSHGPESHGDVPQARHLRHPDLVSSLHGHDRAAHSDRHANYGHVKVSDISTARSTAATTSHSVGAVSGCPRRLSRDSHSLPHLTAPRNPSFASSDGSSTDSAFEGDVDATPSTIAGGTRYSGESPLFLHHKPRVSFSTIKPRHRRSSTDSVNGQLTRLSEHLDLKRSRSPAFSRSFSNASARSNSQCSSTSSSDSGRYRSSRDIETGITQSDHEHYKPERSHPAMQKGARNSRQQKSPRHSLLAKKNKKKIWNLCCCCRKRTTKKGKGSTSESKHSRSDFQIWRSQSVAFAKDPHTGGDYGATDSKLPAGSYFSYIV